MHKFFLPEGEYVGSEIIISGDTAHHINNVLRLKPGSVAILCDRSNTDYICELISASAKEKSARFIVLKKEACNTEPPVYITLYQALPKSDKMDWIIQKCVEAGVSKIVPVVTARTISRGSNDSSIKSSRYNRISESAAAQSKRGIVPKIEAPTGFKDLLSLVSSEPLWLIAYENEKRLSVPKALCSREPSDIGIWIGPEGGFTDDEISALKQYRAVQVTLGRRILRTETAGLIAIAQVLCCWEDM